VGGGRRLESGAKRSAEEMQLNGGEPSPAHRNILFRVIINNLDPDKGRGSVEEPRHRRLSLSKRLISGLSFKDRRPDEEKPKKKGIKFIQRIVRK